MPEAVTRLNVALEGRYRIERELGEGGMATVYLAKDLKHNRYVALKVLKPELAAVVGAERFLAEIETTANLQHPHILPLFDSGEADSFLFYVMPYVEGESLRERLDREHQLPVDEAVALAKKVAGALQAAHERGVIHRDIKPANILLSKGEPLVSDFGIALAVGAAGGGRLTETGLSLGTPHYMSPEQATGDTHVGPATDVYALGCVLYEMLVGDPPHVASTPQAILGKIITEPPPSVTKARKTVPANVEAAIARALEKVPADRFIDAAGFAAALTDPAFRHGQESAAGVSVRGPWNRLTTGFAIAAGLMALALGSTLTRTSAGSASLSPLRFSLDFDADVFPEVLPDGSGVVYVSEGRVMLRRWDALDPVPVPGTEGAMSGPGPGLAVSPSGTELGFIDVGAQLKVVPLRGGVVRTVSAEAACCVTWPSDGHIYYSPSGRNLRRVPETGGPSEEVTQRGPGEPNQGFLQLLPGGEWGVFATTIAPYQIEAVQIETGQRTVITEGTRPFLTPTGHLVFSSVDGQLLAAGFDPSARRLTGPAVPILDGVRFKDAQANFSLSPSGDLVYVEGAGQPEVGLTVMDLQGNEEVLPLGPRSFRDAGWSRDGASVVYSMDGHIYTYNVVLNTTPRQLTFEGVNRRPVLSPDGSKVVFTSVRAGAESPELWVKSLNDDSPPRLLLPGLDRSNQNANQWPSDSLIVFERSGDLWTVDLSDPDDPRAEVYLTSEAFLRGMVVSPDGTKAAYLSFESGSGEVYIRSFPEPGAPTRVSQSGGTTSFWSPDGSILYYRISGGGLLGARIQPGPVPVVLAVDTVLERGLVGPFQSAMLHPDGDRLILMRQVAGPGDDPVAEGRVILVKNFFEELKRLVPN